MIVTPSDAMRLNEGLSMSQRQHMKNPLGYDIDAAFKSVWDVICCTEQAWVIFRALYTHSKSRLNVLNSGAPHVFAAFHQILWDYVAIQVAKLLEQPKSGSRAVLSLERIINDIPGENGDKLYARLCEIRRMA